MLSTATTTNCTRLSRTPSTSGEKWSMDMIWKLKSTAQLSRTQSLGSMPPKPFFMQSRYSPPTAMTMLSQSRALPRRPTNSPNTGTITTYIAVRNAALAVEGFSVMPICWAALAANRKVPQIKPAVPSVLRSAAVCGLPVGSPRRRRRASKA